MILDVDRLVRLGFIAPGLYRSGQLVWRYVETGQRVGSVGYEIDTRQGDRGRFELSYRLGSDRRPAGCLLRLETSRPHFGGLRWWFVCPFAERRVRMLYLHTGSNCFASREALGLTYQVCREDAASRARRRADKLRHRLGPEGQRPKGMHRRTFMRLAGAAEDADARSWSLVLQRFAPYATGDD